MKRSIFYCTGIILGGLVLSGLGGCKAATVSPTTEAAPAVVETQSTAGASTGSLATMTATSGGKEPLFSLAARVNGMEIGLAEYQAEIAMIQAAKGTELAPEDQKRALDNLIDQALLAQGANEKGFIVDEAMLQERISYLSNETGGEQAFQIWLTAYHYDEQSFQRALTRSIAAAWMRDQIAAATPLAVEQVHARQILLYNEDEAQQVYQQLKTGSKFVELALQYDPLTGGDLGWFPRGYLLDKKVEEAVFSLQAEQFSAVVESPAGFHLLQAIEHDPQHPLSAEARLVLQTQAITEWLAQRRSQSQVEITLP